MSTRNTIDTRDLYERLEELRDLKSAVESASKELADAEQETDGSPEDLEAALDDARDSLENAQDAFTPGEQDELTALEDLASEIGETTMRDGEALIPESEFEDYARQLAEDIGAIPDDAQWPCTCIDWEKAADELRMDYTSVTYDGTDYLIRA